MKSLIMKSAAAVTALMMFSAGSVSAASRVSVHDPSIIKDPQTGTYYVFGSHIDAAKSSDLQNWKVFTNGYQRYGNKVFDDLSGNLSKAFAWAGEDLEDCVGGFAVWAPDVWYDAEYINSDGSKGAYLMYFCTSSTYMRSVIAYAASKTIEGPYRFVDTLIYSGFTPGDSYVKSTTKNVNKKYTSTNIPALQNSGQVSFTNDWFLNSDFNNMMYPNAIDPTIYTSKDGKTYMCYGSWSGGIFSLEIDPKTGRCIHPKTGKTEDGRMVDSYFGTKISGGYRKSGEGPFIEYNEDTGYYYLWVTYGGLFSDGGYNMRVFRSRDPLGPFTDPAGHQAVLGSSANLDLYGLKVMGNYNFSGVKNAYMAGGHNSVLKDDDGKWYLIHHQRFDDGSEYHEVRVHSMYFNEEGWPVAAPHEYTGENISAGGYNTSDITGKYEFVNHGTDTSDTIHSYSEIMLNADGTISGSQSGRWVQNPETAAVDITLGKQRYSGYFLAQKNESGKTVMTFTAVGTDNVTVWGSKTDGYFGSDREASVFSEGWYSFKNLNSDKWITEKEGNVIQDSTGSVWKFESDGSGLYAILSEDGRAATVERGDGNNGNNIFLSDYTGADSQKFKVRRNADGTFALLTKVSDFAASFDVYEISKDDGANICQWEYWTGEGQKFILNPEEHIPAVLKGDLNRDGSVSAVDMTIMIKHLMGGDEIQTDEVLDLNDDGIINIADLILLKNILLG